jgi:hypothetical protein
MAIHLEEELALARHEGQQREYHQGGRGSARSTAPPVRFGPSAERAHGHASEERDGWKQHLEVLGTEIEARRERQKREEQEPQQEDARETRSDRKSVV